MAPASALPCLTPWPPSPGQGDVRSSADCERMVAEAVGRFGGLDVLINCAAGEERNNE